MIIGFTGTRKNLTYKQITELTEYLNECISVSRPAGFLIEKNWIEEVHHGDCIGADATFHRLVNDLNLFFKDYKIKKIIHPPLNCKHRAFMSSDYILKQETYLKRNRDIVNACDILLACPKESKEILRSGTWSTVRYARKKGVPVKAFLP